MPDDLSDLGAVPVSPSDDLSDLGGVQVALKPPAHVSANPQLATAWANAGPIDRLKMMAGAWSPTAARVVPPIAANMAAQGINMVGTAGGATLGGMAGGIPGAVVGAGAGNSAAQGANIALGLQDKFDPAQAVGAAVTAGGRTPITAPIAAVAGGTAQSLLSSGSVPTLGQLALYAGLGEMGAGKEGEPTPIEASRDAAWANGRREGLVVDPNAINPSLPNRVLGSIAGKADQKAVFSRANAPVVNDLGVRAMGLPPGTELDQNAVQTAIAQAKKPYDQIRSISPQLDKDMDELEDLQYEAANLKFQADTSAPGTSMRGNPAIKRQIPNADLAVANKLAEIKKGISASNQPELGDQFDAANVQLAKIGEVENAATDIGNGTLVLSAKTLAQRQKAGVPLTDELKTLADFGTHFGDYVQDPTKLAATGSSKLAPAVAIGAGAEGLKSAGPIGMLAAGVPFMDKPVRALIGSDAFQNAMVNPSYQLNPGLGGNLIRYAGQQLAAPIPQQQLYQYAQGAPSSP